VDSVIHRFLDATSIDEQVELQTTRPCCPRPYTGSPVPGADIPERPVRCVSPHITLPFIATFRDANTHRKTVRRSIKQDRKERQASDRARLVEVAVSHQ